MSTYTIGETAGRSGFSASALRYYEGIGLVQPAARTAAGYRVYDDHSLARLAFIARAKQLGCTLEEITDLVGVWDGARCGPVQRRFHDLVTAKLRGSRTQIAELSAFARQLQSAAEQLGQPPVDGPCGPGCACVATVPIAAESSGPASGRATRLDVPIACTLEPGAMPDRLVEWDAVLAFAHRRTIVDGGVRVELDPAVDVGEVARLMAAEQRCCAFFAFALTVDDRGVALEVRAPEAAGTILADLFGTAA